LGSSLCGIGCYVQHNVYVTRGQAWGSFVEARTNAAEAYASQYARERTWARKDGGRFGIFLSSSTEPFQPLERNAQVTRRVLEGMLDRPPDLLILQSHSHHVADYLDLYRKLSERCELRFHVSIESDRDELPGLPRAASPVAKRVAAAVALRSAGLRVVVTVSPLLPIENPSRFFAMLSEACDAVVIDHFIGGDGSANGTKTLRTALPNAMAAAEPSSVTLTYRDQIVAIAQRFFPGRTGVNIDGFAGRMLP